MVRVLLDVMVKSPLTAGDSGDAETSRVTSCEDGPLSAAVTLVASPFSLMEDELSWSVALGVTSSSVMVSVSLEGGVTPRLPPMVADTVAYLSGSSTPLSIAVMVTVPALTVEPAAIVRVLLDVIVKSPSAAGGSGDAETTRVTSSEEGPLRDAVTLAAPPFSFMVYELSPRVTAGAASSSTMVSVTAAGSTAPNSFEAPPYMETVLSGVSAVLSIALTVNESALLVEPASIVNVDLLKV